VPSRGGSVGVCRGESAAGGARFGAPCGAGLVAALALGAQGVLMGTRFLATHECPVPKFFKNAIVASDGTDTVLSTVPDTLTGRDWPGAWSRVARSAFVEDWTGQEPELRRRRSEVQARLEHAWEVDQPDYWNFWWGQSAGLVESVLPVACQEDGTTPCQ